MKYPSTFDQLGFGTLLYTRPAGSGDKASIPDGNVSNGIYRFIVRLDGKVMEADNTIEGASVIKSTYAGKENQQWSVTHLGGGQYSIKNVQSGRSLEVTNGSLDHGAKFQLAASTDQDQQKFAFISTGDGYYRITPVISNKPADVTGLSTAEGVPIQQWRYTSNYNQQWKLESIE
ncbi:RICIN domain-containing protein [Paenibacillus polymyxa]|uniref:RICIN domain-containing protein n=1 Tax=Paenibacillus polymyxa TaxID=1406 RepID=UPI000B1C8910|nr:RICIN domain-containing protein [Paenibacillus polymyxa]